MRTLIRIIKKIKKVTISSIKKDKLIKKTDKFKSIPFFLVKKKVEKVQKYIQQHFHVSDF